MPPPSSVPYMSHSQCASNRDTTVATLLSQFPRHLARQIRRALIALGTATTRQLVEWAYRGIKVPANWHYWNVRRCCRYYGIKVVGVRGRSLLWALPEQMDKT